LFEKQENVLIRALICGPKAPVWVAGKVPALVAYRLFAGLENKKMSDKSTYLRAKKTSLGCGICPRIRFLQ
jgi:hypothetical protein